MDTFLTVSAQSRISSLPTAVEPVNDNLRTRGFAVNSRPTAALSVVVTTLKTPAGTSA